MNTPAKLGGFALAAVLIFGAAYGIGQWTAPTGAAPDTTAGDTPDGATDGHGDGHGDGHAAPAGPASGAPGASGLMIVQDGYRLELMSGAAAAGVPEDLAFRILGPNGQPVTAFSRTHDKLLHLIVVRRDLTGFQHVHPAMGADGSWRIPLTFPAAGTYRAFADFAPDGRSDPITLGGDIHVAGQYRPVALPAPSRTATVDDYAVRLDGDLVAGRTSELTLTVSRAGRPVTDLQPYLAAYGHLVALRNGDLAYLHVHPDGAPGDGRTRPGPAITFFAEVPSAGDYGLFLDFRHQGVVRTAAFTVTADAAAGTPAPQPHGDHDHGEG